MTTVIVVPLYNEAARWKRAYWQNMTALPETSWLFVNDGSTDRTMDAVNELTEADNVHALNLQVNVGKAEALRQGLQEASRSDSTALGFMDGDGAFDSGDVLRLVTEYRTHVLNGPFDSVWSSRVALAGRDIARSLRRHYIGRIVATIVSQGWDRPPYDTQSGLKIFQPSPALDAALATPMTTRWFVDLEIQLRWEQASGRDLRIWEVPLMYWHDVPGSSLRGRALPSVVREVSAIKRLQRSVWRGRRG